MDIGARLKKIETAIEGNVKDDATYTLHVGAAEEKKYSKTINGVTTFPTEVEWNSVNHDISKDFKVISPNF